jgi:hypothetical protein
MKLFSLFLVVQKGTTSYRTEERPCVDFVESLDRRTWDDAWDACKRKGGELAFFRTQEELQLFIKNHSTIEHRWLGIYRDGELWRNIRGEFQNILDWNVREPNDSGGKEDCVMIYRNGKEHWNNKFNDEDCSNKWPFTCRIENCPPEKENSMLMDSGISDVFEYEEEEEEEEQEELVFNEEIIDVVDSLVNHFLFRIVLLMKNTKIFNRFNRMRNIGKRFVPFSVSVTTSNLDTTLLASNVLSLPSLISIDINFFPRQIIGRTHRRFPKPKIIARALVMVGVS